MLGIFSTFERSPKLRFRLIAIWRSDIQRIAAKIGYDESLVVR